MGIDGPRRGSAAERATGNPRRGAADAAYGTTIAACLDRWGHVQLDTERALLAIPDAALARVVEHPGTGITGALWEMGLSMVEHEIHHRGQLSAYLKMLGVDQPALLTR